MTTRAVPIAFCAGRIKTAAEQAESYLGDTGGLRVMTAPHGLGAACSSIIGTTISNSGLCRGRAWSRPREAGRSCRPTLCGQRAGHPGRSPVLFPISLSRRRLHRLRRHHHREPVLHRHHRVGHLRNHSRRHPAPALRHRLRHGPQLHHRRPVGSRHLRHLAQLLHRRQRLKPHRQLATPVIGIAETRGSLQQSSSAHCSFSP